MSINASLAIEVRGLSKHYFIKSLPPSGSPSRGRDLFKALDDVSFEVNAGEVVGVVGRNGAGKSTLLKVLTRITAPTCGEADLRGRVGSLLEVGTGFHPELTGRENIFLNGSILGMKRAEIRAAFDDIVSFAGIERFLDTPVKRYSSGMYVRLAFAVAAHLRSEILLIDEVLAVGDVEFQKRCLGKMRDVARSGRTVLFLSHHLQSVAALCSRLLVLDGGRLRHDGEVQAGIELYMRSFAQGASGMAPENSRPGSGELRIVKALPERDFFESSETKRIRITVAERRRYAAPFFVSLHFVDASGVVIAQCDSRLMGQWFDSASLLSLDFSIRSPWLKPGSYRVDVFLCASGFIDQCESACSLEILPILPYPGAAGSEASAHGTVFADFSLERVIEESAN